MVYGGISIPPKLPNPSFEAGKLPYLVLDIPRSQREPHVGTLLVLYQLTLISYHSARSRNQENQAIFMFVRYHTCAWALLVETGWITISVTDGLACMRKG